MTSIPPFHLAFPVRDKASTRQFYGEVLGATIGREAELWIDFDFFGHQLSAHVRPEELVDSHTNPVDGEAVPVRHFGAVLEWQAWHALVDRIEARSDVAWLIEPTIRFAGQVGEQATFFVRDPSGNALEFKSFRDPATLFAT